MPEPSGVIQWHETLTGNIADNVPDIIDQTNALVKSFLDQNKEWATAALDVANTALANLSGVRFDGFPDPPDEPPITSGVTFAGGIATTAPCLGTVHPHPMPPFNPEDIVIPDVSTDAPTYTPVVTGLFIPDAPVFTQPDVPTEPALDLSFETGEAPEPTYGPMPPLAPYTLPVFTPIVIPPLDIGTPPEFTQPPPNPVIPWVEPIYISGVKDAVEAVILEMLQGGTGLPPSVELAIWERGREREDDASLKLVTETTDQWATRGFTLPPGLLNGQQIAVREASFLKVNELSREIMIKQADLEQKNREFAVTSGISFEQVYVGLFMSIVDRNFQIAKFQVETALQIFNAYIQIFNTEQAVFAQQLLYWRAQLEAAMVPLQVYKVQVEAEQAKAQMNMAIVGAWKAEVEAYTAQVEAYKARVEAEVAKASQQKLLVDIYTAQIAAMNGQINGQKGMFDAYTARVGGETAKAQLEESNSRAYVAQVQGWSSKNELFFKRAEMQIAENKLDLDYLIADVQRATSFVGQELNLVQANLAAYQANVSLDSAKASAQLATLQLAAQNTIEVGRLGLGRYQASLEKWKADAQHMIQLAQIQSESLRAAGTIASNLAAGAMAGTHVSAGTSAGASTSQSRSDQKQESKAFNQGVSDNYSVTHQFPHKAT